MKLFLIIEKIDTDDYSVIYESSDRSNGKDILEVLRRKYPNRILRLVQVLK